MGKEIDARGLSCPGPVMRVKDAVEKERPDFIKVMVDNPAAGQNVHRFLESQNYTALIQPEPYGFSVAGKKNKDLACQTVATEKTQAERKKIMVMVTTDALGRGDDTLGSKLMVSFLKTLKEMGAELWRLVFLNNGVKLTVEGVEALPFLKELEAQGVHILVCGTCLTYFNLLEEKQVGETTNMLDIVTAMQLADTVINI
ncbi:sulfurtransferase-like selenium metabolism protein YedF [Patescibacteria group bacterium]|nr:sulfurtransferase-like selenium metabolism protein YedF [Patescibacteria group bacterium]